MIFLLILTALIGYFIGTEQEARKHNEYLRKHLTDLEQ